MLRSLDPEYYRLSREFETFTKNICMDTMWLSDFNAFISEEVNIFLRSLTFPATFSNVEIGLEVFGNYWHDSQDPRLVLSYTKYETNEEMRTRVEKDFNEMRLHWEAKKSRAEKLLSGHKDCYVDHLDASFKIKRQKAEAYLGTLSKDDPHYKDVLRNIERFSQENCEIEKRCREELDENSKGNKIRALNYAISSLEKLQNLEKAFNDLMACGLQNDNQNR